MSGRTRLAVAACLVALMLCVACSPDEESGGGSDLTSGGDDPQLLLLAGADYGFDALMEGELRYRKSDRCLVIRQFLKDVQLAVPKGSTPINRDGERGVLLPSGTELLAGNSVKLTGGMVSVKSFEEPAEVWCRPGRSVFAVSGFA